MKKILFAIFAALVLASCRNEDLPDYEGGTGLYFFNATYSGGGQRDSIRIAFFTKQVPTDGKYDHKLDLRLAGDPSDKPRAFKLRQTNLGDDDAALPGRHFVPLDDPLMVEKLVWPAHATECELPITLINSEDLQTKLVRLELEIEPNENFIQSTEIWSKFVIWFGDMTTQPTSWVNNKQAQSWWYYFGNYTAMKMRYISMETELYDFDLAMFGDDKAEPKIKKMSTSRMLFLSRQMYAKLEEYNAAHPGEPMLDEYKRPITFPKL